MLLMLSAAVPRFETVIVWAALVLPRFWFANVRFGGLNEAPGPTAVPLKAIFTAGLAALRELVPNCKLPARFPALAGANARATAQLVAAARLVDCEQPVPPDACC